VERYWIPLCGNIWWWPWLFMSSTFGSNVSHPHVSCWLWNCIFCLYSSGGRKVICLCYLYSLRRAVTVSVSCFNAPVLWFERIWCVNRAMFQF
jgi:hypothetical protein